MSSADLIVALDAGTSSIRAVLFDRAGTVIRRAIHRVEDVDEATIEIEPSAARRAAFDAIAALRAPASRVAAIGVTGALGLILIDEKKQPLTPLIGWRDRRATEEAREIAQRIDPGEVYAITGRRIDPELTAAKLLWLRRRYPQGFKPAAHALSMKDWLVRELCGAVVTDPTSAGYSLLYDVRRGVWSETMMSALDIRSSLLPPIVEGTSIAGGLLASAASETGLRAGTPVAVGGPDGTMGNIGGGLVRRGLAVDVIGTTDVIFAYAPSIPKNLSQRAGQPGGLIVNRFPVGDAVAIGGPMLATGGASSWFAEILGSRLESLTEAATKVSAGSDGLTIVPALAGTRAPNWRSDERGALSGLSFSHGRGHIFRALLEGSAAEIAEMLDALGEAGVEVEELRAVGGGANSNLLLQIRASMLNRPIIVPQVTEASALGAAMVACVAIGLHADLGAAGEAMVRLDRRIEPLPEWIEAYVKVRRRLKEVREALAGSGRA